MNKKTVFLLLESEEANKALSEKFSGGSEFEVVGMATDGIEAITMLDVKRPGVLITELLLPGDDGTSVISKVKDMGGIKVVVLSALCSDSAVEKAIFAGADYFMRKPCNFERLIEVLTAIINGRTTDQSRMGNKLHCISIEERISKIFINVGIPPHIKGYAFLREGVKMAVEEPSIINHITKKLYPSIGEKFQTTPSKVERAIRHAIEVAWNRGRIDNINNIYGNRKIQPKTDIKGLFKSIFYRSIIYLLYIPLIPILGSYILIRKFITNKPISLDSFIKRK
jgi:two-component system response regulator (stage 0 sporulation protein A)